MKAESRKTYLMKGKGKGWYGESERHAEAALKGKQDVKDSKLLLRTLTKRLGGESNKSKVYMKGFREGVFDSVGEERIADLTEGLEYRFWKRMGEYGFAPQDYKDVEEFKREFENWKHWEDAYNEITGEVASEFDLKIYEDELAIEVLTDIVHNGIYTSIMNSMDEMIKEKKAEEEHWRNVEASRVIRQQRVLRGGN